MTTVSFDGVEFSGDLPRDELMVFAVNQRILQLFQSVNFVTGVIMPPTVEHVRSWALSEFDDLKSQQQAQAGITESMYLEAKRWQAQPLTPLNLNTGRKTPADYAGWVVTTWDKIEADYRLAVNLVNQASDVETIEIIIARRF